MTDRLSNFFGRVYPTYDHAALIEAFGIRPGDKVLDIGGGHNPLARADFIVDSDLTDGVHRGGQPIPPELRDRYVPADIHCLPFADKSIDFIYCSHVLEHVLDPETACRELMRVGRRGFIETPRKWSEFFAGYPSHQWLIDDAGGELVFERRQFIESPYLNALLHAVWRSKRLEASALRTFLNVSCVQYYWEDSFTFRVVRSADNNFDYMNPDHAALSHFHFAKNIFLLGAPPEYGIFHAEKAASLRPDNENFLVLLAGIALEAGNAELWKANRDIAYKKGVLNSSDTVLLKLGRRAPILKKLRSFVEKYDAGQ